MIRHIVLTKFKRDVSEDTISEIYDGLNRLVDQMDCASGFTGGRSKSPEQIERGYMHGFVIDFNSWESLQQYIDNKTHKQLGKSLVDHAEGGIEGILVLDLEV
ncbi:MAG: Dabb family protein [Gammaproteobacteria bacterium]|nr:Dabb family protein [Gammaproteobacteria bacterium]